MCTVQCLCARKKSYIDAHTHYTVIWCAIHCVEETIQCWILVVFRNLYGISYAKRLNENTLYISGVWRLAYGTYRQRWKCNRMYVERRTYLQFSMIHSYCSCIHWKHPHNSVQKYRLKWILFIHTLILEIVCGAPFDTQFHQHNRGNSIQLTMLPRMSGIVCAMCMPCVCVWLSISIDTFYVIRFHWRHTAHAHFKSFDDVRH